MALVGADGNFVKEAGCACWICTYIDRAMGTVSTYTTKTEVLAEHPPKEAVQVETTEERNERIWRAIKDAAQG